MSSSSRARATAPAAVILAALAGLGCSRAAATPPAPPPAVSSRGGAAGAASSSAAATDAAAAPDASDPSEVMTAAELASIPDPVPPDSPATTEGSAGATDDSRPTTEGSAAGEWRVQIYASPDLAQADRVAKEGSVKLGVAYVIEFEGSLYKVRLGAFSSESEAQALRERAVGEGFPGAFRVWVRPGANDSFK